MEGYKIFNYQLTIGLNDKDTLRQEIATNSAKKMIADLLLNDYNIYAFTMIDCSGVYKMNSGEIVFENSIRLEIVNDCEIKMIQGIINTLKFALNQECIMLETAADRDIQFI